MPGPFDQGWRRIVVAASGPSFTVEQAERIERARAAGVCKVLAINATALSADPAHDRPVGLPNADAMYGADASLWNQYGARLQAHFRGQMWTRDKPAAVRLGLKHVRAENRDGLTTDPSAINTGGNSGYAGINLAYLFGGRELALVGFDMKLASDGRAHHHGNHEGRLANPSVDALAKWCAAFGLLARHLAAREVAVWQCSLDSNLRAFPRADLSEVLERWRVEQLAPA